jgi:hypothetical protein
MQMNEVKIGFKDGYNTFYDPNAKVFRVRDPQGNEVSHGTTQDQVEKQIPDLVKQALKLPVAGFMQQYGKWQTGRITSVNIGDRTAWFSFDDKTRRHAEKVYLDRSGIYAITPKNQTVIEKIQEHARHIVDLNNQIALLETDLEMPINREYFEGAHEST